jgi:hypothetical protein
MKISSRTFRPTPSFVVASIALFTALGGGAYAAVTLPAHSVGTRELRAAAVTSAKVRDHSLKAVDFQAGQLPAGPKGDTGPIGPKGDAGPKGERGTVGVHVVSRASTISAQILVHRIVSCPDGEIALGGGGHIGSGGISPAAITRDEPLVVNDKPVGWQVIVDNGTNSPQDFNVSVICAPAA